MVTDPVCGMTFGPAHAATLRQWAGQTFYFCSPGCKKSFDKEPEKYVGKEQEEHSGHH